MVATARKPKAHWREEADDSGDEQLPDEEREASRLDWETINDEVEGARRKVREAEDFAAGRRGTGVVDYEDIDDEVSRAEAAEAARVAELAVESRENARREAERLDAAEDARNEEAAEAEGGVSGCARGPAEVDSDDDKRPGPVTAGQAEKIKSRAGKNKTGSSKKRVREKEEDKAEKETKKRKVDDADRWMKLKLKGDEKSKKIDTTRIVHYHDYDMDLLAPEGGEPDGAVPAATGGAAEAASSSGGNFRAMLRRDLWDDDEDD